MRMYDQMAGNWCARFRPADHSTDLLYPEGEVKALAPITLTKGGEGTS